MNILTKLSSTLLLAFPLALGAAQRPATPFTDAEIDQMLAPIALYPDTVLSHVLIAATVPEDVEDAADWIERHPDLRGQAAVDAVERFDWDPSVKALVAFPEVLERMADDPDWTEELGLAFLEQEEVVMDRVQHLRDRAYENGSLENLEHVRVVREREYIYLEPAVSRVVYVPYYDPYFVYGHWWWPAYPPHRWTFWAGYPVRHYYGQTFWWGVSYHLGPTWYAGAFNWHDHHVVVSRPHRHYTPSPGYSGSSPGRHDVARHDSRQRRHDRSGRPGDSRRPGAPVRGGHDRHDEGDTHVPQGGRREARRHWTDVRAALTERRQATRAEGRTGAASSRASRGTRLGMQHSESVRVEHDSREQRSGDVVRPDRGSRAHRSDDAVRSDRGSRRDDSRGSVRTHERERAAPRSETPHAPSREQRPAPEARVEGNRAPRVAERPAEQGAVRSESRGGESRGRGESRGQERGHGGSSRRGAR